MKFNKYWILVVVFTVVNVGIFLLFSKKLENYVFNYNVSRSTHTFDSSLRINEVEDELTDTFNVENL